MKAIPTFYHGIKFRSRLEARWAAFFDACGVEWAYEVEGYELDDGTRYLPDFRIKSKNISRVPSGQYLWVEVKGKMTNKDLHKIEQFSKEAPIIILGDIPIGRDAYERQEKTCEPERQENHEFNFEFINGDTFPAFPGIDINKSFNLFGDTSSELSYMDSDLTNKAYIRTVYGFEHGEKPPTTKAR